MSFLKQNNVPIIKREPLNLKLHNNFLNFNKKSIKFNNEMEFNIYEGFKNFKDFKINKKSALLLTDFAKNTEIFEVNKIPSSTNTYEEVYDESVLTTWDNWVVAVTTAKKFDQIILEQRLEIFYTGNINVEETKYQAQEKDVLKFIYLDETTLMVKSQDNLYLTEEDDVLKFLPKQIDEDLNKFNYLKGTDEIYLFRYNTDFTYMMVPYFDSNTGTSLLKFSEYYSHDRDSEFLQYFKFKRKQYFTESVGGNDKFVYNSKTVIYDNSSKTPYKELKETNTEVLNNFLIHFPISAEQTKTDIIKLKNLHTSKYEYSDGTSIRCDVPAGTNRIYDRIHSGQNVSEGNENIVLNYRTNTEENIFISDSVTEFIISPQSEEVSIQNVGLLEEGALYGNSPETSDCVLVHNVQSINQNFPNLHPTNSTNYTWACSWLFKYLDEPAVWMDRFYNSAIYSSSNSLSGTYLSFDRSQEEAPYYDVESSLIFKPGGSYLYRRCGKKFIKEALNKNKNTKLKILQTGDWKEMIIKDETNNDCDGIVYEKIKTQHYTDYYNLIGSNHVIFPSNNLIKFNTQTSISLWMYAENWTNLQGQQLFGNYYDGGLGLINEAAALAPIFTIADANKGYIGHFNFKFKQTSPFSVFKLPGYAMPNNSKGIIGDLITIRLPDYTYWIFDCYNLYAFKYDANNSLINRISSENNILDIEYINQIEINSKSEMFLYDDLNKKIIKLNQEGKYLDTLQIDDSSVRGFEINNEDELVYVTGYKSVIDNNNNLWEAKGVNLYKNKHIHSSLGAIHALTCDYLNNIWALHGDDLLTVISADTNNIVNELQGIHVFNRENVLTNECSDQFAIAERKRFINFIRIPQQARNIYKSCGENELLDLAVIVDANTNLLSLVDLNLNQYHKVKLDDFNLYGEGARIYAAGDFSNYQFQRKYANNLLEKNISWKVKLNSPGGYNPYYINLKYNTQKLSRGWHHFVLNLNCASGFAEYYLDGVKVDEDIFDAGKYYIEYKYKSPILVGATTIRDRSLNDVMGLENDYKFIGKVSDIQIYNSFLDEDYIKNLYMSSSLSPEIQDLTWNQITGTRNFLEEITGWLKFKVPGIQSKFFNINIQNFENVEEKTKMDIVQSITEVINKITPAHTKLHQINW